MTNLKDIRDSLESPMGLWSSSPAWGRSQKVCYCKRKVWSRMPGMYKSCCKRQLPHAWSPLSLIREAATSAHSGMCEVNRTQEPWEMKTQNEATCVLLCLDQWGGWLWRCVTGPRGSVLTVVVEGESSRACGSDSTLCPVYLEIRCHSFHLDTRRYFWNKQVCHSWLQGKER